MTVGADPDELLRLAAGGPGQAFTLDHGARTLELAGTPRGSRVDPAPAVARLRWLRRRIVQLDGWVVRVASALRAADSADAGLRTRLLALGAGHPAGDSVLGTTVSIAALPVDRLTDDDLDELAAWPRLPGPWRDRIHRERAGRWLARLDERLAAVPGDPASNPLDLLARWFDRTVVDRLSPVVDLHVSREERLAGLEAEAAGVARLLATPDLTVWSFEPGAPGEHGRPPGRPTIRVALGEPDTATDLAVLLPGTASGVHAPAAALRDARALHGQVQDLTSDAGAATVLDLYAAPTDLGRAADPRPGRVAGRATAQFLADLPDVPGHDRRVTLVGHSYGAYTAAQAVLAGAGADAVVLLGAPGAGVATRSDLPEGTEVWAARAPDDPITVAADLDELVRGLPERWRPSGGPLLDPLVALGPDPTDPEFGARRLSTAAQEGAGHGVRGHLDYLQPGSAALHNVARVVLGDPP